MEGGEVPSLLSLLAPPRSHTRARPRESRATRQGAGASLVLAKTLLQGPA